MKTSINKYNIVFLILCFFVLTNCDRRKDYFDKFNTIPKIEVRKTNTNNNFAEYYYDSVWVGNLNNNIYDYKIIDNVSDTAILSYENIIGDGQINYNVINKTFSVANITMLKNRYRIKVTDRYNSTNDCELQIYKLNNRKPISKINIQQTNLNSSHEINVSGINSFDLDQVYGDFLSNYQFKIGNTYTVNTVLNNINYIAATSGTVMIKLKVIDSKGLISKTDSTIFNIQ